MVESKITESYNIFLNLLGRSYFLSCKIIFWEFLQNLIPNLVQCAPLAVSDKSFALTEGPQSKNCLINTYNNVRGSLISYLFLRLEKPIGISRPLFSQKLKHDTMVYKIGSRHLFTNEISIRIRSVRLKRSEKSRYGGSPNELSLARDHRNTQQIFFHLFHL